MGKVNYRDIDWLGMFRAYGLCPRLKQKKRSKQGKKIGDILNVYAAFDIETSTIWKSEEHTDAHAFMYVWQFAVEDYLIKGRTWEEFFECLQHLKDQLAAYQLEMKLPVLPMMVIWVHNLAFEFTFLSGLYPFTNDEVFFRDARKPIYCRMFDCFEFRCSYVQSNMSLKALTKQTGVKVKLSGQEFDYSKVRFPWTELTDFEEEYTDTDVISLVQAMKVRVSKGGDNLATVPLTSTGYVRRECKRALADRYTQLLELKPWRGENGYKIYRLLRDAFRGGNTHANRFHVGKICEDVYSYDIASSYPTQQLTHKFPMKPFKWLDNPTPELVCSYIGLGYAVVGRYRFTNVRLKNYKEPVPYISLSRCKAVNFKLDNGRILECDYLEIALTEIDLQIILKQYDFNGKFLVDECMIAEKDYLPAEYREVIQRYYAQKTILKGATSFDDLYMYARYKELLNAIYGMSATAASGEIVYDKGEYFIKTLVDMKSDEIEKRLRELAFCYQWGVYTTAYARLQLQDAIDLCGDKLVYCDTDSVKTIGDAPIHELNSKLLADSEKMGAFAFDREGKKHNIGVFDFDGHYKQFITQGAKRYAYIKDNDKMGVTVSGVTKQINEKTGVSFAVEELKTLKRFKPGMIWKAAGGRTAVYNDNDDFDYQDPATGKSVHIGRNVAIIDSTYEMGYSKDYAALLNEIKSYTEYKNERM